MNEERLNKLIDDFSHRNLTLFLRSRCINYAEIPEELPQYNDDKFSEFNKLGEIKFENSDRLVVVTSKVSSDLSERSGKKAQYEKAKKILREMSVYNAGFFIFYDESGNFRFSLVYAQYEGTKVSFNNFRRFTYFVDKEQTNNTFKKRVGGCEFISLEKIKDAFSVEKVTEDFYKQIADWYFWAVPNCKFPNDVEIEPNGKNNAVIRLITRLIFIWFMKERKLIPLYLFKKEKMTSVLNSLNPDETTYYKAILQNLFFATLNTKQENRKFRFKHTFQGKNDSYMNHSIYRYEDYFNNKEDMLDIFQDIPFLNGGLFDCLDWSAKESGTVTEVRFDGFTDKEVGLSIPNYLFFSEEKNIDLNKDYGTTNKKYQVQGILNILSSYNFTIDENDPNDQEVALDPELLGKVFEKLLASFNPETATTARKDTGSYYTPREIVDYMVTQSLKQYYITHLGDVIDIDSKLNILLSSLDEEIPNPFSVEESKRIVKLTEELRIVDPAVGSGAFPMGILNKLVAVLSRVDHDNQLWREAQLQAVENFTDPILKQRFKEQINTQFTVKSSNYGRKLYLIQKCIYGVDIQPIAIEIAKLRFFISLLVDENIDKNKPNWGIEPLPNLDFKLMQGNSLISEFMGINLDDGDEKTYGKLLKDEADELITEFQKKKDEFQNEPDRTKKNILKHDIEALMLRIFESKLQSQRSDYFSSLKQIKHTFTNYPDEPQYKEAYNKKIVALNKKYGFDLDKAEQELKEFSTGQKVKPFFAWKLYFAEVFNEKGGFDIVIGNPPYIQLQKDSGKLADMYKNCGYKTFERTGDIYTLFYERGINILRNKGHLCFITSNKWMRAAYGEKLRSYFMTKNPRLLIDLGPDVFENATVDTNIILVQNAANINCLYGLTLTKEVKDKAFSEYIDAHIIILPLMAANSWYIGSNVEQKLKEKIERNGKPLKDWDSKIYRGLVTGLTDAFIIDTLTKEHLCMEDPKSAEILKPILRGRDIKRYSYNWAGLWLIQTGFDIDVPKLYPAVYRHLLQYKDKAIKRDDQGKNWWNLRACVYYPEFEKGKIVWSDIAKEPTFTLAPSGIYFNNTVYMITNGDYNAYVCGVLNSKVNVWYFPMIATDLGESGLRYFKQFVECFPVPTITFNNEALAKNITSLVLEITTQKKQSIKTDTVKLEREIDELVYKLYDLTPEEIAIVKGNGK